MHTQKKSGNRAETVRDIRKQLGRTQAELAQAMGISEKAIQSYEQGWRNVPTRALIQLMVLLAIHKRTTLKEIPCWDIRKCPRKQRDDCPSYQIGRGQFCWFVASNKCGPPPDAEGTDILPCMRCPVIRRLLATPSA